jgi:hypothetical protein
MLTTRRCRTDRDRLCRCRRGRRDLSNNSVRDYLADYQIFGHPALAQHLHAVITLMRVSKKWDQFKIMLDIAHPKRGDTLQLPLMAEIVSNSTQRNDRR